MRKQTYKEYMKEQKKLAQKQAIDKYKKKIKKNIEPIKKTSKRLEKVNKSASKAFKKTSKAVGYKTKLSNTLLGYANADRLPQAKVGRPKGILKHTSPFTGKLVPATVYYQQMREFKRLQARRVEDAKEQQLREYAKRGIPPNQIQNYQQQVAEKVRQQQLLNQVQQQRSIPQNPQQLNELAKQLPNGTVIPQGTRVWKWRRGVVGTEGGLFGRQQKVYGLPESFWN